ncbi:MAG: hypothetical protein N2712_00045 [Brevinematales bacterium]|nr:hypothetical protein [Brevinematales bacterium]
MYVGIISSISISGNNLLSFLKKKGFSGSVLSSNQVSKDTIADFVKKADIIIVDVFPSYLKETISKIKQLDANKAIFVLGNNESYTDLLEVLKLGIYKYIKKPFDLEILNKLLKEYQSKEEINERNIKKGFAIYTRKVNDIITVNIFGYFQEEIIKELKEILKNNTKVIISLNGISSSNLNPETLGKLKEVLQSNTSNIRIVLLREKIKNILVEEGIDESLIYPNEFLAVKSF